MQLIGVAEDLGGLSGVRPLEEAIAQESVRGARAEEVGGAANRDSRRSPRVGLEHVLRRLRAQRALLRHGRHRRVLRHVRRVAVHVEAIERDQARTRESRPVDDSARHGQEPLGPLVVERIHAVVDHARPVRGARHGRRVTDVDRDRLDVGDPGRRRRPAGDPNAMPERAEPLGHERADLAGPENDVKLCIRHGGCPPDPSKMRLASVHCHLRICAYALHWCKMRR